MSPSLPATLLLGNLVLVILGALTGVNVSWASGILIWIAVVFFWPTLRPAQRHLGLAMIAVGSGAMAYAMWHDVGPNVSNALASNALLVGMLTGLALLPQTVSTKVRHSRTGRTGFVLTMLSITGLGGLINIAAMVLLGDRLRDQQTLTAMHLKLLGRAYSIVAAYSPFIGGMALVLHLFPDAQLKDVWSITAPVVIAGLLCAYVGASLTSPSINEFKSVAFNVETLWCPGLLVGLVLMTQVLRPDIPIVAVIAIASTAIAMGYPRHSGPARAQGWRDTTARCARLGPESLMFMSAGFLAQSLSAASETGIGITINAIDPIIGVSLLWVCVLPSFIGVHPIVPITVASGLVTSDFAEPAVLVAIFATAWAIGCTVNPFAGIGIVLQTRYRAGVGEILRWQWRYTLVMTIVASGIIAMHT